MSHDSTTHDSPPLKPVKRALFSVSDKTGLVDLATALSAQGVELVGTSSTAKALADAGLPVQEVSEVTGFPEILGGRVKTLHPAIHGPVLAQQDLPRDLEQLEQHNLQPFDVVVCNLYPFQDTVASGASAQECVEMIDIGGPTLIRAAAKNFASVVVLSNPGQYDGFVDALNNGGTSWDQRRDWAVTAFRSVTEYDVAIANWMGGDSQDWWSGVFSGGQELRYGENPHQKALVYQDVSQPGGLIGAQILGGKALSYNNYQDAEAAVRAANGFAEPTAVIIKHANPSGVATAPDLATAYAHALACDPLSAFGGVVAVNGPVTLALAQQILPIFTEVVAAPSFAEDALELLRTKPALRLLQVDPLSSPMEAKFVSGGLLRQSVDQMGEDDDPANWELVAGAPADEATLADLAFAWQAAALVKSNAVLLAKDLASVGIGMGQVSRVDAARLAVQRANTLADGQDRAAGSVAASDAFFPFPDGLQILLDAGVKAVVAPGGSKGDEAVIAAAEAAGVTLYFTKRRHFWH